MFREFGWSDSHVRLRMDTGDKHDWQSAEAEGVYMESSFVSWLISLITGAVGGNIAGALFKNLSLGSLGNTIAGVVGGGIGGQLLSAVLGSNSGSGVVGNIVGSGAGSIVIMAIVGFIKNAMGKKA